MTHPNTNFWFFYFLFVDHSFAFQQKPSFQQNTTLFPQTLVCSTTGLVVSPGLVESVDCDISRAIVASSCSSYNAARCRMYPAVQISSLDQSWCASRYSPLTSFSSNAASTPSMVKPRQLYSVPHVWNNSFDDFVCMYWWCVTVQKVDILHEQEQWVLDTQLQGCGTGAAPSWPHFQTIPCFKPRFKFVLRSFWLCPVHSSSWRWLRRGFFSSGMQQSWSVQVTLFVHRFKRHLPQARELRLRQADWLHLCPKLCSISR